MEWQPIETAPLDGTPIQAEIPGYGQDNIIRWSSGFMDDQDLPVVSQFEIPPY